MVRHVRQFPSDQDCKRLIDSLNENNGASFTPLLANNGNSKNSVTATQISLSNLGSVQQLSNQQQGNCVVDKDLIKRCMQCMELIFQAKDKQTQEANRVANNLLKEIESEKSREQNKKAAAQRKREKRKLKKKQQTGKKEDDEDEEDEKDDNFDNKATKLTVQMNKTNAEDALKLANNSNKNAKNSGKNAIHEKNKKVVNAKLNEEDNDHDSSSPDEDQNQIDEEQEIIKLTQKTIINQPVKGKSNDKQVSKPTVQQSTKTKLNPKIESNKSAQSILSNKQPSNKTKQQTQQLQSQISNQIQVIVYTVIINFLQNNFHKLINLIILYYI